MKNLILLGITILLISVFFPGNTVLAQTSYPLGQPTSYYILPGKTLGFSGLKFNPGEKISLYRNNTLLMNFTADSSGKFSTSNVFWVPYSFKSSTQPFYLIGNQSAYPIKMNVAVGDYYPQISPSYYYVGRERAMTITGNGFAPNENVNLYVNGVLVREGKANTSGRISFSIITPLLGDNFIVEARGMFSNTSNSKRVYLFK